LEDAPAITSELVCPVDRAPLRADGPRLVCSSCGRRYPVRDGIPVLIEDEAERQ
jgi:uncharacterized protein YbaR (Trm112 family)